jgi:endonuclease/exonuclease/phosphatase (EEP) superfamily protein YafD
MRGQQRALNVLRPALTMLVIGLALVAALSWLAAWHWAFELLSHFHVYFLLGGAALALLALGLRQWPTAGLASLVAAASFSVVWPHLHLPPTDLQPQGGPMVRLIWANLHHRNTDLDALRRLIETEKPDIMVLTELDPVHDAVLRDVARLLPFQSEPPRANAFGIMLLARKPPESLKFDLTMGDYAPLMVARLCPAESGCLTLLGLHAWRPGPSWTAARDRQLAHAAAVARRHVDEGERVVLAGDLNLTPFSPAFDRLTTQSGLWDTAILPAERPRTTPSIATWWLANTGIGLPIDHALVSSGIGIVSRRVGPDIGSDHHPLILDLKIAP